MIARGKILTFVAVLATAVTVGWNGAAGAQQGTPAPFTDAQATAGQTAYGQACAACHGAALGGGGEAPPLVGPAFIGSWGSLDVIRDPFSDAASGGLRLTALMTADVTVSRPAQIEILTDLQ